MDDPPAYRRVLLKLSGELLAGEAPAGIAPGVLGRLAGELAGVRTLGVELGVVVGGGNFFRGLAGAARGMDRDRADAIGMLATAMNALALVDALERAGQPAAALSAIPVGGLLEPFSRARALELLGQGRVLVFAGGTGNPYFTTDTAAALRALQIGADALLKGTRVDGVYDADPEKVPGARRFDRLSFDEALRRDLRVMDAAAFSLCRDNALPVVVFDLGVPGELGRVLRGEPAGTLVTTAA